MTRMDPHQSHGRARVCTTLRIGRRRGLRLARRLAGPLRRGCLAPTGTRGERVEQSPSLGGVVLVCLIGRMLGLVEASDDGARESADLLVRDRASCDLARVTRDRVRRVRHCCHDGTPSSVPADPLRAVPD
jgi:hypothetical protein